MGVKRNHPKTLKEKWIGRHSYQTLTDTSEDASKATSYKPESSWWAPVSPYSDI